MPFEDHSALIFETVKTSKKEPEKTFFAEPLFRNEPSKKADPKRTWHKNNWKNLKDKPSSTSILDHVYTDDVTMIENLAPVEMFIGDHSMISMSLFEWETNTEYNINIIA